jgi:photosystem II stability/assembly factor-like uncharacterized protein
MLRNVTRRTSLGAVLIALLLAGCEDTRQAPPVSPAGQAESGSVKSGPNQVHLMHVHGLAYDPDGSRILIPSHLGLAVFDVSSGTWSKAEGPAHDYMGFSATKDAIYSSGHPAMGSGFTNPFGVIKSTDGGQTWRKLGFEGETDFHLLATGYTTNAVYVVNPHPNSKLKEEGIYYTLNDGFTWEHAQAKGLESAPTSLAVHPTDSKTVAVGTEQGLFVSRNAGATFEQVNSEGVGAVSFGLDGQHLWFGALDEQPGLTRLNLASGKVEGLPLPKLENDAASYIAQNPENRKELAVATFRRSILISPDGGQNWKFIAENGNVK